MTNKSTAAGATHSEKAVTTWASGYWQDEQLGFSRWGKIDAEDGSTARQRVLRGSLLRAFTILFVGGALWALGRWVFAGALEPLGVCFLLLAAVTLALLHRDKQERKVVSQIRTLMQAGQLQQAIGHVDEQLALGPNRRLLAALVELQARAWLGAGEPLQAHLALQKMPQGEAPSRALRGALLLCEGDAEGAIELLREDDKHDHDDGVAGILCAAYISMDQPTQAAAVVLGRRSVGRPLYNQLQQALSEAGVHELAIQVGEQAFTHFKNADDAIAIACSYCRAKGQVASDWEAQACDWLERAAAVGHLDADTLLQEPELRPLHGQGAFQAVVATLRQQGDRVAQLY